MDFGLEGKLVLVTGSTKGIGKAIATAFVRVGAKVVIHARTPGDVEAVVKELNALSPGNALGVAADLSDPNGAAHLIGEVEKMGPLDVCVCNVGMFQVKPFPEVTDEEWMQYFNTNVMSCVRLARHFLPRMLERNQGRMLIVASEAAWKPLHTMLHYSVTKGAQLTLSRGMAEMTKGTHVTVNTVIPGPTWTEGVENYICGIARQTGQSVDEVVANYFKVEEPNSLLQRFIQPKEVANVTVFLGSALASAVNGSAYRVEGGITRHT